MKKKLLNKFLSFSYGSWIGLLLGMATTMITTRLLLPEALGKASMFDLFIQVGLIFVIFGTDQSFIRFFYEEGENKRGALLYNSLKVPLIALLIFQVLIMFFYKPITLFLFDKIDFNFALLLSIGLSAQLIFRYGQLVVRMKQKGNLYSLIQIFQRIFNLAFILLLFNFMGNRFEVLIYSKVFTLILLVIFVIYAGKEYWSLRNLKINNTKHTQTDIIRYGLPFLLTIFITWLFESFDKIALRQWSDFNELGLYSAAMKLVALVMILKQTFSTFWTPVAYERFENNPEDKTFYRNITIIVSFVMFLVAIGSIIGKDIIVLFLGKEYREAASIMPFLVFMPIFYTISETTVMGINFYKKTKWHILIAGIACIVNIVGNWLLVPNYGAIGASVSTAFSYIIFFTLRTQISLKYFKVNYPLFRIYLMILVVSAYALYSIFITNTLLNIAIGLIPVVVLIILFYKDLIIIFKNNKT